MKGQKKAAGDKMRMTRQRLIIQEELRLMHNHPTADEIYKRVTKKLPRISLGTVYRNLDILSDSGSIRKLELGLAQRRYDGNVEEHHHVRCVECGRIDDVPAHVVDMKKGEFKRFSDFEFLGYDIEFFGLCPGCKKLESDYRKNRSKDN